MKFIIQTVNGEINGVEEYLALEAVKHNKYTHTATLSETTHGFEKGYVPIGSLEFVGNYLREAYNVNHMNPIEIPKILRTQEFLQRDFKVAHKSELSTDGDKFIKDIGTLKAYNNALNRVLVDPSVLTGDYYSVSDWINIVSEYRVFVLKDEIQAVQHYMGDPLVYPDSNKLTKMSLMYSLDQNRPEAYTLDVAITAQGHTVILEIHPFVSCGTYGFDEYDKLFMYKLGFDWYVTNNKGILQVENYTD